MAGPRTRRSVCLGLPGQASGLRRLRRSPDQPQEPPPGPGLMRATSRPFPSLLAPLLAPTQPRLPPSWGRCRQPTSQALPHLPEDHSSWRMSVSPPNLASTRTSVPQSLRKPAASVCPPAATDARGHASAPPRALEGLRRPGGPRAALCAVRADVLAGGGDCWPWCFLTGPSPGPQHPHPGQTPQELGFCVEGKKEAQQERVF